MYVLTEPKRVPTSLAAIAPHNNNTESSSPSLLAAAFTDGSINIYDLEVTSQSKPVLIFEGTTPGRVNAIAVHPTMPVLVSAHEDRQIKLWDLNTGQFKPSILSTTNLFSALAVPKANVCTQWSLTWMK